MRERGDRPGLRVIGVASGKGGVGKSQVSANLAVIAAAEGLRVLVVDGDLGLANVEILFGLSPKWHLGHVLKGEVGLAEAMARGPLGVKVLPAGHGVPELTRLSSEDKQRLIGLFEGLEDQFDLVLLDAASGIGDVPVFFAGGGQEVLLVVQPEPTSLADAYAMVKALRVGAGHREFFVAVNVASPQAARDTFDRLTQVSARFLDVHLRFAGAIPRDENVHRATLAQKPVVQLYPHSPASRALVELGRTVLGAPCAPGPGGGLKFLLGQLVRDAHPLPLPLQR